MSTRARSYQTKQSDVQSESDLTVTSQTVRGLRPITDPQAINSATITPPGSSVFNFALELTTLCTTYEYSVGVH